MTGAMFALSEMLMIAAPRNQARRFRAGGAEGYRATFLFSCGDILRSDRLRATVADGPADHPAVRMEPCPKAGTAVDILTLFRPDYAGRLR